MQLTNNFSLEEFTRSITAKNHSIDNTPSSDEIKSIQALVINVLQPAREYLNQSITISSGYRSYELNKLIGGSKNSQHVKGEAVDIICKNNSKLFNYILNNLEFDQLIWEFGNDDQPDWVHVSYSIKKNRKEILKAKKQNNKTVYQYL